METALQMKSLLKTTVLCISTTTPTTIAQTINKYGEGLKYEAARNAFKITVLAGQNWCFFSFLT